MKDQVYLVLSSDGVARMTKRAPSLYRNEVAVFLQVSVPDSCFRHLVVSASIEVPEDQAIKPTIEVEALEPPTDD